MINVVSSQMNVPHSALEIYVSGCTRHCPGCQNAYLQDYKQGIPWKEWNSQNSKKYSNPLVSRIWMLGGDLLCQSHEDIIHLIQDIRDLTSKELWLWTGETMDNIRKNATLAQIALSFDYVKVGPYDENNHDKVIYLIDGEELEIAGSNQYLYRVENTNPSSMDPLKGFIPIPCNISKSTSD